MWLFTDNVYLFCFVQMLTQVLNRICHPENTFSRIVVLRLPGKELTALFSKTTQDI